MSYSKLEVVMNLDAPKNASKKYLHIKVELPTGEVKSLLLTSAEFKKAEDRAEKNGEDYAHLEDQPTGKGIIQYLQNLFSFNQ